MKTVQAILATATLAAIAGALGAQAQAGVVTGQVPASENAVVFLDKVPGSFNAGEKAEMDQADLKFAPKVLVVLQGTTVEFKNNDSKRHNVFGVGSEEFDLGTWTKGLVRTHTFKKVGYTTLLCNVHPEMEASVLVLQNPYYAKPDSSGRFTLNNVPAGKYNLIYWRPNKKAKKKKITVSPGGPLDVALD